MSRFEQAWHRWWRSTAGDVTLVLAVTVVLVLGSYGEAHPSQPTGGYTLPNTPPAAYLLVALATLVLVLRRRYPVPVLLVSLAAVCAYSLAGYVNGAALLAPAVALYTVASTLPTRRAVAWTVGTTAALMIATAVSNPFGPFEGPFPVIPVDAAAALFLGLAVTNRRAYVAAIRSSAEQEARQRVDAERLRIARELHDVVAHTMATINVQAGTAAHVLAERPEAAGEALRSIKAASKEGLRELRAILNVLRQVDEAEPTQPAPGLGRLDALLASASRAGLVTTATTCGVATELPAAVDLVAYRVVQESLTNAIRYAAPASAHVTLTYSDTELAVEVTDTGPGPAGGPSGDGSGHGLVGMRERAASVGGTLTAGAGPGGGFRVHAVLPLRRAAATTPVGDAR